MTILRLSCELLKLLPSPTPAYSPFGLFVFMYLSVLLLGGWIVCLNNDIDSNAFTSRVCIVLLRGFSASLIVDRHAAACIPLWRLPLARFSSL